MREVEDRHIRPRSTTQIEFDITSLRKILRQLVYTPSHSYVAQHPLFHPVRDSYSHLKRRHAPHLYI